SAATGWSYRDSRPAPRRLEEPVPSKRVEPLGAGPGWYHRLADPGATGYGQFPTLTQPPDPTGRPRARLAPAADLGVHPARDPGRRGGAGDAASLLARAGGRSRGLAHDHAARRAAAPGGGLSHRAPGLGHLRGGRATR